MEEVEEVGVGVVGAEVEVEVEAQMMARGVPGEEAGEEEDLPVRACYGRERNGRQTRR